MQLSGAELEHGVRYRYILDGVMPLEADQEEIDARATKKTANCYGTVSAAE